MRPEMLMPLGSHPIHDVQGNIYKDFNENLIVVRASKIFPSADGLFEHHRHSKKKKDVPHLYSNDADYRHDHEIAVIHKKHAESKEHFGTEFSILAYPDAELTRSFHEVAKHIDKADHKKVMNQIQEVIINRQPRLITGPLHTILTYNQPKIGLTSLFELNKDGYQLNFAYDEPSEVQMDTNGKIAGKNPYYIASLEPNPTPDNPSMIETSIEEIKIGDTRIGIFVGLLLQGDMKKIVSTFKNSGLIKAIKEDNEIFPQWPDIITPFLTVHLLS